MSDLTYTLPGTPGRTLLVWNSLKGLAQPQSMDSLPEAVSPNPPPPAGVDKKIREDMLKARDHLGVVLAKQAMDVGLAEEVKSADPARRVMAVRCFAAVGDIGSLIDAMSDERFPEIRQTAMRGLQHWMVSSRENEYQVYDQLKQRFSNSESERIMELFHGVQRGDALEMDTLVDRLNSSNLVIRELAYMNLFALVPEGRTIAYNPVADETRRAAAQKSWREVIRKAVQKLPTKAAPSGM